jgi:hypothetical protein
MSKLIREITAVFDEAFQTAEKMIPDVLEWMVQLEAEEIDSDDFQAKVKAYMRDNKPKTYTDYAEDLVHIFESNGYTKPNTK